MSLKKEQITEKQFSRAASTYDNEAQTHRNVASYLITHSDLPFTNGKIIDIGSGTGIVSELLIKQFSPKQIYNLDISFNMLKKGKEKVPNSHFIQASMQTLPFQNTFDVLVSNMSLQWLEDPQLIVKTINNCLKKDSTDFAVSIVLRGTFEVITNIRKSILKYSSHDSELSSQAERLPIFEELKTEFGRSRLNLSRAEKHIFRQTYSNNLAPFDAIRKLGISGSSNRILSPDEHEKLKIMYQEKISDLKRKPELDYVIGFFWGSR